MCIQVVVQAEVNRFVEELLTDITTVHQSLSSLLANPPVLTNTPPIATRLIWLRAVRERAEGPLKRLKESAPQLLEGEIGFTLRHVFGELMKDIERFDLIYMYMYVHYT